MATKKSSAVKKVDDDASLDNLNKLKKSDIRQYQVEKETYVKKILPNGCGSGKIPKLYTSDVKYGRTTSTYNKNDIRIKAGTIQCVNKPLTVERTKCPSNIKSEFNVSETYEKGKYKGFKRYTCRVVKIKPNMNAIKMVKGVKDKTTKFGGLVANVQEEIQKGNIKIGKKGEIIKDKVIIKSLNVSKNPKRLTVRVYVAKKVEIPQSRLDSLIEFKESPLGKVLFGKKNWSADYKKWMNANPNAKPSTKKDKRAELMARSLKERAIKQTGETDVDEIIKKLELKNKNSKLVEILKTDYSTIKLD